MLSDCASSPISEAIALMQICVRELQEGKNSAGASVSARSKKAGDRNDIATVTHLPQIKKGLNLAYIAIER